MKSEYEDNPRQRTRPTWRLSVAWIPLRLGLIAGLSSISVTRIGLASPIPDTPVPIESIWVDNGPKLGVQFKLKGRFFVASRNVDSVTVSAYYVSRWEETKLLNETSRIITVKYSDTIVAEMPLMIPEAGEYILHFWALGWLSYDSTGQPQGANDAILVEVPAIGTGRVVDEFQERQRPGARERITPPVPVWEPREHSDSSRPAQKSEY